MPKCKICGRDFETILQIFGPDIETIHSHAHQAEATRILMDHLKGKKNPTKVNKAIKNLEMIYHGELIV